MIIKSFLVTGGSGFLGKPVCEFLFRQGYNVVDISLETIPIQGCQSFQVDISRLEELQQVFMERKIDVIIHLAALLHTASWKKPADAYRVNVQGSFNLLELARKYHVPRFVFGSTVDALGFYPTAAGAVKEDVAVLPSDLYGETKRVIEKLGLAYRQQYGLEFISTRIPFLVGPGKAIPTSAWRMEIFNLLKSGGEIDFGFEADTLIPMADIRDSAAEICALAAAESPNHPIYNLPCESIRVADLAGMVQQVGTGIQVKFGARRGDFYPARVDFSRFMDEFKLAHMPIQTRLEKTHFQMLYNEP
jgi:nucleoside-diphosphate-sugar epimerase